MGACTSKPPQKSEADLDRERWAAEREWKSNPKAVSSADGKLTVKPQVASNAIGATRMSIFRVDPTVDEVTALIRTVVRFAISGGVGAFVVIRYPQNIPPLDQKAAKVAAELQKDAQEEDKKIKPSSHDEDDDDDDDDAPPPEEYVRELTDADDQAISLLVDNILNEVINKSDSDLQALEGEMKAEGGPIEPISSTAISNVETPQTLEQNSQQQESGPELNPSTSPLALTTATIPKNAPHVINLINSTLLDLPLAQTTATKYKAQYSGLFTGKRSHTIATLNIDQDQVEQFTTKTEAKDLVEKYTLAILTITPKPDTTDITLPEQLDKIRTLLLTQFDTVIILSQEKNQETFAINQQYSKKFIENLKTIVPMFSHTSTYTINHNNTTPPTDSDSIQELFQRAVKLTTLATSGSTIQPLFETL